MDGVAGEVAQEVGVLLQHQDVDARAREQEGEHHAGRPAARDAAGEGSGRIAAILALYEDPDAEHVTDAASAGGCELARWYLEEARRIAEGSNIKQVLVDAHEVLAWLKRHPEHRTRSGLLVYGPTRLRTKAALDPVLAVLAGHGWIVLPKLGPITVRE